ncbi:MAG: hypothetical protein CUN56_02385 [Phototrophicales bacterium]|nr:MAG: hypothetical protein CUN56_02385 [Phototrophicales bacterium]RMG77045.1 MAG: hypothetical protein D6711_02440 [Chloroflexota bacterium]
MHLLLLFILTWFLQPSDEPIPITVDPDQVIGAVSQLSYGANYGPLQVVTVDLIPAMQQSGLNYLRFPGGRWGDENDIRSTQIDDLMRIASMTDAEVSISVRLENGTPEQAAELVRLVNIEGGHNVRLWSIGNEPNLFDDYDTVQHNQEWRAIAEAMLEVDPSILLMGPDTSQFTADLANNPKDSAGRDWVEEFLRANGDLVDIVTVHRYPFPRSLSAPVTTIDDLRANVTEWDDLLPTLREMAFTITGRELPVALTEVNSHWSSAAGGEASPDSHFNAIWWADVLGRLLLDEPFAVAYFDLQSSPPRGGTGLMARYEPRPTYYVYQIYQRFGTQLVKAESPVDDVTAYAALRDDGALTVIVVNLSDEVQTITFDDLQPIEMWRFDQAGFTQADPTLTLTPQSITLFVISN